MNFMELGAIGELVGGVAARVLVLVLGCERDLGTMARERADACWEQRASLCQTMAKRSGQSTASNRQALEVCLEGQDVLCSLQAANAVGLRLSTSQLDELEARTQGEGEQSKRNHNRIAQLRREVEGLE